MNYRVRISSVAWQHLRASLLKDREREYAALLVGRHYESSREIGLVLTEVADLPADAYATHRIDQLRIPTTYVAPLIKRVRSSGESLVFAHSHPWSIDPTFSSADDHGESEFFPALQSRAQGVHGALVVGDSGAAARVHTLTGVFPASIEVVGDTVQIFRSRRVAKEDESDNAVFDRQQLALESTAVSPRNLAIGVVGAGGTGSAVIEQLLRMGVGDLIVIDPDKVEDSNLSRLVLATDADARSGKPKAELAPIRASELGQRTKVLPIVGDVRDCDVVLQLRDRDLIFACTDSHSSRVVLNQLAFQYLIPVVDLGARIIRTSSGLRDAVGEIRLVGPDRTCLICQGVLDPEVVTAELRQPVDREEFARRGYVVGPPNGNAPSLVNMTVGVAAFGVTAALNWLGTFGEQPPAILVLDFAGLRIRRLRADPHATGCPVGGVPGVVGMADARQLPCRKTS